jgi:hypothetical protein
VQTANVFAKADTLFSNITSHSAMIGGDEEIGAPSPANSVNVLKSAGELALLIRSLNMPGRQVTLFHQSFHQI